MFRHQRQCVPPAASSLWTRNRSSSQRWSPSVRALPGSVLAETRILSRVTPGLPNTMRRSSGPPWQPVRTPPEIAVAARRDRGNLKALLLAWSPPARMGFPRRGTVPSHHHRRSPLPPPSLCVHQGGLLLVFLRRVTAACPHRWVRCLGRGREDLHQPVQMPNVESDPSGISSSGSSSSSS